MRAPLGRYREGTEAGAKVPKPVTNHRSETKQATQSTRRDPPPRRVPRPQPEPPAHDPQHAAAGGRRVEPTDQLRRGPDDALRRDGEGPVRLPLLRLQQRGVIGIAGVLQRGVSAHRGLEQLCETIVNRRHHNSPLGLSDKAPALLANDALPFRKYLLLRCPNAISPIQNTCATSMCHPKS